MNSAEKKGFDLSLRFVSLFAAAHVVLVLLQTNFVPLSGGWNVVWLGLELLLGGGAFCLSLGCFLYAKSKRTPSLEGFDSLFRQIRSPGLLFLLMWTVWAYVACFIAIREGRTSFYHNVRYLFYQTADLLVLFPLGVYYGKKGDSRLLSALYDVCLALFAAQLFYAFYRFLSGEAQFTAFFGRAFDFSILRAIFGVNSNHTGAYAAFFLIAGLWRFRSMTSRAGKVLLIAALAVTFIAFVMVESRGAIFGVVAAVGFFAGALCWRKKEYASVGRAFASIGCCVVAAAAFLALFYGARAAALSVQDRVLASNTTTASEPNAEETKPADETESSGTAKPADKTSERSSTSNIAPAAGAEGDKEMRSLIGKRASSLGGRKNIWLTVIRGMKKDRHILLHGTSMANTSDWVATVLGTPFRTHNQFLELLTAEGLPALILFILWLIWLAGKSLGLCFSPDSRANWLLPLSLLLLLVHNMVEMMIVARPHVVCGFFYLVAGYVAGFAPKKQK